MRLRKSGFTYGELVVFYAVSFVLLASGLVWLYFDEFVTIATEIGSQPHPLQSLILQFHGVVAWIFLFAMGWLLGIHMRFVWPLQKQRVSGFAVSTFLGVSTLSGFALYYIGSDEGREFTSLVHWTIGLVFIVALIFHVLSKEKTSSRPRKRI